MRLAPLAKRSVFDCVVSDDGLNARIHILIHDGAARCLALLSVHTLIPSHNLRVRWVRHEDAAVFEGKHAKRRRQRARRRGKAAVVGEVISLLGGGCSWWRRGHRHHLKGTVLLGSVDRHTKTTESVTDKTAVVHAAVARTRVRVLRALFLMRLHTQHRLSKP
ncbi:hypothetical protein, conserved [Leishmania tarentolae]|uniref:Uncharacterized protein n=1 Tax=Leishmania tarentolae TaxID=5689 RepID=A0A640KW17_LEITA|nr:hypothetical protein, conserved [Leishmania tarentolae]